MSLITIFVILLAVGFATIAYFGEPSEADKRTRERLTALTRRVNEQYDEGILKEVTFSRIAIVDRLLRHSRIARKLELTLEQAKVPWTVGRLFFYSVVLMALGGTVGNWWVRVGFFGWLPGMALGVLPLVWVLYKRSVRLRRMNLMLPDAINLMGRALRAGYSLPSSLVMVADEMSDPLGPEFRRTSDELNFGLPFQEALSNLGRRISVTDFGFLMTAILVQKETGGNLIELFDKMAAVLRSRIQFERKVRVHTAQGRLSGAMLIAMPFVLFVVLNLLNPGYSTPMFESETGRKIIYGTLVSMGVGVLVIRRIIKGVRV
jgi:tight adherence protein B